ncbi:hypothetical protein [Cochlodiniinecator piscidefendens]|uniref:hypothetical protein n=1 Tax=Cochlodiniinecator piscidefendens TaxID=2715756 RepID=UPI00140B4B75|nr:hypothetical protein [Cochlodiniinecator piscidefendens]
MKLTHLSAGALIATLAFTTMTPAEDIEPLRPSVVHILNSLNIPTDSVEMTSRQQRQFVARIISLTYGEERVALNLIEEFNAENQSLESSAPTLRELLGRNDPPAELTPGQERQLLRALARPSIPDIDYESLTIEEKRRLLAAVHSNDYHFINAVRSLIANR